MVLWGIERAADQRLWLAYPNNLGSALVQVAGVALAVGGVVVLAVTRRRWRAWLAAGAPGGRPDRPAPLRRRLGRRRPTQPEAPAVRPSEMEPAHGAGHRSWRRGAARRRSLSRPRPGAGDLAQVLGLSPEAAAARYSSSLASRPIGSWPTVESRRAAISSGVQRPAEYTARTSTGWFQTAILLPTTV